MGLIEFEIFLLKIFSFDRSTVLFCLTSIELSICSIEGLGSTLMVLSVFFCLIERIFDCEKSIFQTNWIYACRAFGCDCNHWNTCGTFVARGPSST